MSIPGEATFRQQFGEYLYLRQVISERITFAVKRSASALVEQFFHDPLKRMPISMNRPCFVGRCGGDLNATASVLTGFRERETGCGWFPGLDSAWAV
jgi:hypothetical protein